MSIAKNREAIRAMRTVKKIVDPAALVPPTPIAIPVVSGQTSPSFVVIFGAEILRISDQTGAKHYVSREPYSY